MSAPVKTLARWLLSAGLGLALLSACSSLPVLVPDLAPQRGTPVPIAGARGPLSPAQSKAVLARLKRGGSEPTDIFSRHLALEESLTGSPLTAGNNVTLLQNGPNTYRAMIDAIMGARDHVNMETYILEDDEVGRRFVEALLAKRREGVQIDLIHDSVGTLHTPKAFFQRLKDAGIEVLEFNPVNPLRAHGDWELNQRDHRKLLVVDGKVAFLGGINISSVYSGGSFGRGSRAPSHEDDPRWRDTDIEVRGPVVADFQKLFMQTWAAQHGPPLPQRQWYPALHSVGNEVVRAIGSSPDDPYSQIYVTLLSAIGAAESSVHLTNAYFVPDPQLLTALKDAARRGVDVTLILPSKSDSWLVFSAGRSYYTDLLEAGVKIYERRGVILHSKTALIDGVWSTIGSTNLDWRSFLHNQEINAVVLGAEFGTQVQAMFDRDLKQSTAITLEQWKRRTVDLRLKEWFGRLWEYWL